MSSTNEFDNIAFDLPKNQSNVIKVIGVGGGGSNAINHMIDDLGFNLFSLANNHAFDHSWQGYRSTLVYAERIRNP